MRLILVAEHMPSCLPLARLRQKLSNLPGPQNEVEISMPELEGDEPGLDQPLEEDQADI